MKRKIDAPRLFAILVALITGIAILYSATSPLSRAIGKEEPILGLMIGTDWVDNARHADTMVLVRYNPALRSLDLLSIPRDTRVDFPHLKVRKMNEIYTYAFKAANRNAEQATRQLIRAVQWLVFSGSRSLSSADVFNEPPPDAPKISYYAQIDYEGFRKIIDLIGGVPVTVDEPMHYDDNWGKLHIHFDPGNYVLNGQKSLEYVRFRGTTGDFGRVLRQQEFLLAILERFKNPRNLLKIPKIMAISIPSIKTNLNWFERLLVVWELKDLERGNIRLMQLPGRFQNGYWIPDPEGIQATAALLTGYKGPAPAAVPSSANAAPATVQPSRSKITVEVWNASGKKGLALDVVRELRAAGFDVVKWGNYSSRQLRTVVRDHIGENSEAHRLAQSLSSPRVEVFTNIEKDPLVDMDVILGEDYGKPSAEDPR